MSQHFFQKKAVFIRDEDFDRLIGEYPLVVVCFVQSRCDLSRRIRPILNQLANDYFPQVKVVKIDLAKYKQIGERFQIDCLPNIFYFKNGQRMNNLVGLLPDEVIRNKLEELL
ncbi:thioredoxin family protein [Capilliphycus salinus ALCB114379]|uniref:thioredoxin family protein n=1 Tax=Capilliphycus salinus TaxID=2768948 RepID=UPI0039A4EA5F